MSNSPSAILLSGIYGTGKTTVLEEIAGLLDASGAAYAAVDLDWLWWFSTGEADEHVAREVLRANLSAIVATYLGRRITQFVLALPVRARADVDAVRTAVRMPMTVVRVTAPIEVIERRLRQAVTTGRVDDLRVALNDHGGDVGAGLEDFVVENIGPPSHAARAVLELARWHVD